MIDEAYGDGLELWLTTLGSEAPDSWLLEVRYRLTDRQGLGQRFYPVRQVKATAGEIRRLGRETDVFVGVGPRTRRAGGADAVGHHHAAWADLDTTAAREALDDFPVPPSLVINSGNGWHVYWITERPCEPMLTVEVNRRLAHHLGGDLNCCDAARVMRAPGTLNHKDPADPKPVTVERVHIETYDPDALAGHLPDPPDERRQGAAAPSRTADDDPLKMVTPLEYGEIFTGQEVGRDGKIHCPFHDDRTPSLHLYPTSEEGWTCFGCQRSGDLYTFCGLLWNMDPRTEFPELRRRIARELRKVVS